MKPEEVRVNSGGKEILIAGLAYTYRVSDGIEIRLGTTESDRLIFRFEFEDDDGIDSSTESEVKDNELTVKCRNFKSALGTGLKNAIEAGEYRGRKLYLTFTIYGTEYQKKLEYCFFAGEFLNNGGR